MDKTYFYKVKRNKYISQKVERAGKILEENNYIKMSMLFAIRILRKRQLP